MFYISLFIYISPYKLILWKKKERNTITISNFNKIEWERLRYLHYESLFKTYYTKNSVTN